MLVDRKDNYHGLGYTSSIRLNDALGRDEKAAHELKGPKLSGNEISSIHTRFVI